MRPNASVSECPNVETQCPRSEFGVRASAASESSLSVLASLDGDVPASVWMDVSAGGVELHAEANVTATQQTRSHLRMKRIA